MFETRYITQLVTGIRAESIGDRAAEGAVSDAANSLRVLLKQDDAFTARGHFAVYFGHSTLARSPPLVCTEAEYVLFSVNVLLSLSVARFSLNGRMARRISTRSFTALYPSLHRPV